MGKISRSFIYEKYNNIFIIKRLFLNKGNVNYDIKNREVDLYNSCALNR